jgi:5-methylcytosine-specific restriction endonuclease McrA
MSDSLRSFSDHEILTRTHALTTRERKLTLRLLLHLNEIERRKLFLKQGCASMFVYCTTSLGYSASAAKRRICTARCIVRFPELLGLLETNEVNLSTITQVAGILTPKNASAVFDRIRGKSQREVEAIVAEYEPLAALPRERVRTVVVRVPVKPASELSTIETVERKTDGAAAAHGDRNGPSLDQDRNGPKPEEPSPSLVAFERRAVIQFSAREAVMAKLERVRALASHRLPANAPLERLIEFLADYFTDREDPAARHQRRLQRKEAPMDRETRGPRHVPARVRDRVFVRDNQKCTFIGPNGKRCASTRVLQLDHITPVARGGAATDANLRVLCAYHNRLEAERLMVAVTYPPPRHAGPPPGPDPGSANSSRARHR